MRVFITGTDTEVGKTVAAAWLCRAIGAMYFKPVQTGCPPDSDSVTVRSLAGVRVHPEVHVYTDPVSPHLAAERAGERIGMTSIRLPAEAGHLVVEGAGGLLAPINPEHTMADLARHLGLPLIVVARSGLGTINHTCLTLEAARARALEVLGVIMNGPANADNKAAIEHYANTRVLAELPILEPLRTETLDSVPLPTALREMFA